jgi:hypothetical protein
MKLLPYLLLLLLVSAQVDDACAVALDMPPDSAADNDEYLPSQRRAEEEESSPHQKPMFAGLKPGTAGFSTVGVPSERHVTAPFPPPPRYAFLPLQI